jgi:hypothetical protein
MADDVLNLPSTAKVEHRYINPMIGDRTFDWTSQNKMGARTRRGDGWWSTRGGGGGCTG